MSSYSGAYGSREQRKEKYAHGKEFDDGTLETLEGIITTLEDATTSKDYQPLIMFFQKGFGAQTVQAWSYYAQVNDHGKFSKATTLLTKTLRVLSSDSSTLAIGSSLIRLLLMDYTKVLYRGLNNMRAQLTNPILRLLKQVVNFNNGQHVEELVSYFDFSLPVLPRLLSPTKSELTNGNSSAKSSKNDSIRFTFIKFWLALISNASPLVRKELLTENFKIMSNLFKFMNKIDSDKLSEHIISVFINDILKENSFKRTTKTKILNELAASKIHHFYNSSNKEVAKKTNEFFLNFGASNEFSVAFPDNSVWFKNSVTDGASHGAPITINQVEFKIHNKLLFNTLRVFKPWEDVLQLNTLMKILENVPELVAPYSVFLTTNGNHDPKMTSYWFGTTLLMNKITNLKIPQFMENVDSNIPPSTPLVIENILPSLFTKSSLTKSLQFETPIIRQLACQSIVLAFKKLEKVSKLYDKKGWKNEKTVLLNEFHTRIPDLPIFVSTLNNTLATNKDNKILPLSISIIFNYYSKIFPNLFSINLPSSNLYTDIMQKPKISGMEFAILDNYLQFQEFNSTQTKWWNSISNENSLFTLLLKLASSKNASNMVATRISNLLDELTRANIIFNPSLISPVMALVNSLQGLCLQDCDAESMDKIWKWFDETISRVVKTPYKYVDLAKEYNHISPFIMGLSEQWKYVDKCNQSDFIRKWLLLFFRNMIFIGEDDTGISRLVENAFPEINEHDANLYLKLGSFEEKIIKINNSDFLISSMKNSSFFQYVSSLPSKDMTNISRLPVNRLDAAGILFRVQLLIEDDSIGYDGRFETTICELVGKIASYMVTDTEFPIMKVLKKYLKFALPKLTVKRENISLMKKSRLMCSLIGAICVETGHQLVMFQENIQKAVFNGENIEGCASYDKSYREEDINTLLTSVNEYLSTSVLTSLLMCGITLEFSSIILKRVFNEGKTVSISAIINVLNKTANEDPALVKQINLILAKFFEENKVCVGATSAPKGTLSLLETSSFINSVVSSDLNYTVLEVFYKWERFSFLSLIPNIGKIRNSPLLSIVTTTALSKHMENEDFSVFAHGVLHKYDDNIGKCTCSTTLKRDIFDEVVIMITAYIGFYDDKKKISILECVLAQSDHRYHAATVKYITAINDFDYPGVALWLNKTLLYITKYLSEREVMSESFFKLLNAMTELLKNKKASNGLNSKIVNAQLEVTLSSKWIKQTEVLEYINILILCAKQRSIQSQRIFQLLLNNDNYSSLMTKDIDQNSSYKKFLSTMILFTIFSIHPVINSTPIVQEKLLTLYSGTISSNDKLIIRMLETIESHTSFSWTNMVFSWEFIKEEEDEVLEAIGDARLITKEKEGLVISLRRNLIERSIDGYVVERPQIPEFCSQTDTGNHSVTERWTSLKKYYEQTERSGVVMYDPLFLLLLIIHNTELVKMVKEKDGRVTYKYQFEGFLDSKLFQFIICSLSDNDAVVNISYEHLTNLAVSLEEKSPQTNTDKTTTDKNDEEKEGDNGLIKYNSIYQILIKRILYHKQQNQDLIRPLVWFSISRIVELLKNPTSPLHEKAYRWILSSSTIRGWDIPMVSDVMISHNKRQQDSNNKKEIDMEIYYGELSWVLATIYKGIKTDEDYKMLDKKRIFEWLLNLINIPYLKERLRELIYLIFYKVQRIADDGGLNLISRNGIVSFLEILNSNIESRLPQDDILNNVDILQNENKNTLNNTLKLAQEQNGIGKLLLGYNELVKSQKRLILWTEGDSDNLVKRLRK
ncbi:urb1p [Saccharomyces arboricola H-6]|uniref:Urb1p n=1 Tax=Saccharomyces arboricola (strain H-6 / AS 2.3317 / CBS 10644) TaxID=1160507 RepID=J8Q2M6_SACAR|nr:urb1p [Saccharomyces arboricola H-6]